MTEVELLKAELEFTIKSRENLWELCRTLMDARHAEVKKEWVTLTDEEILEEYRQSYGDDGDLTDVYFARVIEFRLKEKNSD